jgi:16S rRNA (guanine966-N2)-methyltransferase
MRIISGSAKGVPLESPKGRDVRPTLDRVRETVFNILTPWLDEEVVFFDLFTGTGANGLEAASRGVKQSILVDSSTNSLSMVEKNAQKTKLTESIQCVRTSLPAGLAKVVQQYGPADLIYADPPFAFEEYEELLRILSATEPFPAQQLMIIEHAGTLELPEQVESLKRSWCESYGHTSVSFYERV